VRRAQAKRARGSGADGVRVPPWIAIPVALDDAYGRGRRARLAPSFLADVVWGQYCLFLCIRLQDDVFDHHTPDHTLLYAGDQFLIEAERAFARHFPRPSSFWEIYRTAVETTTRSIVMVDEMQKRAGGAPARLAREYARVAAIFKVGASAIGIARGRTRDLAALRRFFDAMAVGDQILDDLADVDDDLRRGRFNYVAQRVGPRGRGTSTEAARRAIARSLASGDGAEGVLLDAQRRFTRAQRIAEGARLPMLIAVASNAVDSVDALRRAFHRAEVKRVLAPIVAG
jgi:hypothetical protein